MKTRLHVLLAGLVMLGLLVPAWAQQDAFDFAISEQFLKQLADGKTIQPVLRVHMDARTSKVHTLDNDCEIHMATTPEEPAIGWPPAVVVEPPNLCKFPPAGTSKNVSAKKLREQVWPNLFDKKVMRRTCDVKGFPRIFTEHAQGAGDPANPNHVFEVHPALFFTCDGTEVSFAGFLTALPGMRAIQPATAASCIAERTLFVRYADGQYELREDGGQCGNFAIVEVGSINKNSVREIDGGHSAIARVSADGKSRTTLKIYTLAGSDADRWLTEVNQNGMSGQRKFLHGLFTYDYFSIVKTVRTRDGEWLKPQDWTKVDFPLAFIVFGETVSAPWKEE